MVTITKTQISEDILRNDNIGIDDGVVKNVKIKEKTPIPSYEKYKVLGWEFETPIVWYSLFFIALIHILFVYVMLTYPFFEKIPLTIYGITIGAIGGFGITGGVHRHFSHRAYKAKLPLKIILLFCYSVAGQNQLHDWVRDHRVHHKFSDTDADPHNAKRGYFFSHVGWLMMRKHPDVIRKGRTVDMSDIIEDPLLQLHSKYWFIIKPLIAFVIPTAIPVYLVGESWYDSLAVVFVFRYVLSIHSTWAVNSFAHLWGSKPYDKQIFPAENRVVSFFAMGEGYHNYHHTFPWDYRAAEMGSMVNMTTLWLNFFNKIGWAYDMKVTSKELVKRVVENNGDGSHYKWGHEVPFSENERVNEANKIKEA